MEIEIELEPHSGKKIKIEESSVTILVGKNAAGKSQILKALKQKKSNAILLANNYEDVQEISSHNKKIVEQNQKDQRRPLNVQSLVATDHVLFHVFQFFFKTLFNSDLSLEEGGTQFKSNGVTLNNEADGVKSIFNLFYYLVSPHKIIFLDEPERFLHPSVRTIFISILSDIAKKYKKTIVISSHSNLSMRFDLDNIFIYQVQKEPLSKVVNINKWLTEVGVEGFNEDRKQDFMDWFYYHSDILFSKKVALVEGVSDQIVFEALRNKLALSIGLEDLSIKHVGSSSRESGGKGRLNKIQSFLSDLLEVYVVMDKDKDFKKDTGAWVTDIEGLTDEQIISKAKGSNLFILLRGGIESYYFIDPQYNYCTTVENASKNKIPAAYEQARIISQKSVEEVSKQYKDIVEIFEQNSSNPTARQLLQPIAEDYIRNLFLAGLESEHVQGVEQSDGSMDVLFNFTSSREKFNYSKDKVEGFKKTRDDISNPQ